MDDAFRTEVEASPEPPRRASAGRWLRWLVAGNPFDWLSAALLLFGINRLSVDSTFLAVEDVGYTCLALQTGNAVFFAMIALRTQNRIARHILLLSAALVVAAMVEPQALRFVAISSLMVLSAAAVSRWMTDCWGARLVPAGAAISLVAAPAHYLVDKAKSSPAGLIAVIGSFLLFGLGTVAALTRNSWNHSESRIDK